MSRVTALRELISLSFIYVSKLWLKNPGKSRLLSDPLKNTSKNVFCQFLKALVTDQPTFSVVYIILTKFSYFQNSRRRMLFKAKYYFFINCPLYCSSTIRTFSINCDRNQRPIKEILCFLFNFVKKWAPNRLKADEGRYYIFNLILMKNEPQIGWRPIKEILNFLVNFV